MFYLLNFSLSNHFYYLVFFFQLVFIAPLLVKMCKFCDSFKRKYLCHFILVVVLCYISSLSIRYTHILPVYGAGKYLFGGTFLILYYLGMLLVDIRVAERIRKGKKIYFMVSIACWIFWWIMSLNGKLPFDIYMNKYWGNGTNPPSVIFLVFAVISFFFFFSIFTVLEECKLRIIKRSIDIISMVGRYTLHIFLYHLFIQNLIITKIPQLQENIWLLRVGVFIPMAFLPILVVRGCERIKYIFESHTS